MKRSLLLTLCLLIATSLVPVGSASASTTGLKRVLRISGDTAFTAPSSSRLSLVNLRNGKVRTVRTPSGQATQDLASRANSKAFAGVTGWGSQRLKLWLTGVEIKTRILAEQDISTAGCQFARIDVLQIDTRNRVTALRTTRDPSCDTSVDATRLIRYAPDGTATEIALPTEVRREAGSSPATISLRGDDLLLPASAATDGLTRVFNIRTGAFVWEGSLPTAGQWLLPSAGVIWGRLDYLGHASRAFRFNYRKKKLTTIEIPHPRVGIACGEYTVHANQRQLEIYGPSGRLVRQKTYPFSLRYDSEPVCSGRWVYLPRTRQRQNDWVPIRAELIDLSRLAR